MSAIDISWHERWFAAYADRKIAEAEAGTDSGPMRLKYQHTCRVLANAQEIVASEAFSHRLDRAVLLAALYHDVGRFEQYLRHRTFNDRVSCNHAIAGVRVINQEGCLNSEECRSLIAAAVALHNRFALPAHLPEAVRRITLVVRDADKLDILRLMDEQLSGKGDCAETMVYGLPDNPFLASKNIIAAALAGRVASYADLTSVGDFKMLLATWVFDMHFPVSVRRFAADGHARRLLESLAPDSPHATARAALLARFDRLDK
ncbi:MAG: HD domain-containing protein [Desulfobulbaceae bacterium]|jgi:hypothetical protein|nr:HD domain-containing protein [Desulfobulbaceae bacterium]